jgi:peptide/nickel transport system ATP-binding protein
MSMLEVRNLCIAFNGQKVVDNVTFDVQPNTRLGIIGESGSGKSLCMLAIMGLLPDNATVSGSIRFKGTELLHLPDNEIAKFRGQHIGMVFQDPLASLNPLMTVGKQIALPLRIHGLASGKALVERATALCSQVGLAEPQRMVQSYPHQLSGGQRQRVALAIALACSPALLIADEPTTALDVTVQAEVLHQIRELARGQDTSLIFVSHDLPVVASMVDHVVVLFDGTVAESATIGALLGQPQHHFTQRMVASANNADLRLQQLILGGTA